MIGSPDRRTILATALMVSLCAFRAQAAGDGKVDFNRDIRPLLSDRCFHCHGPDAARRKADLRLDIEAEAKKFAISPGDLGDSDMFRRISSDDPDEHMPPPSAEKKSLTAEEIELFRRWIEQGAPWAEHWAFVAPERPVPPRVSDPDWSRNELDRFVLADLDAAGLEPSPEADRETLIRRVSFDLTGLPPTLEEIDAFLADTSPDAFEKVVDRLLTSPHYGERMAMDWLDGARYADTNGFQNDFERYQWPWRDWVINAFNENMPYDQFAVEQIAGDLLPNATESQRIATGFSRNNRANTEGGSIEEEWYVENRIDRVETTSTAFLGLTMGCARCHDHKYDPISQKEFYQFYAFFNTTEDKGFYEETRGNVGPLVSLPSEENTQKLAEFESNIAAATSERDVAKAGEDGAYAAWRASLADESGRRAKAPSGKRANIAKAARKHDAPEALLLEDSIAGSAVRFDETHKTELAIAKRGFKISEARPFTISFWINPQTDGTVFAQRDPSDAGQGFEVVLQEQNRLVIYLVSDWPEQLIKVTTDRKLSPGVWTHVAIAYTGIEKAGGVKVYFSGRPSSNKNDTDKLAGTIATKAPLVIGRGMTDARFTGAIADVRFFREELSGESVVAVMDDAVATRLEDEVTEEDEKSFRAHYAQRHGYLVAEKEDTLNRLTRERDDYNRRVVPSVMVMKEAAEPQPTYRLIRGQYDQPDTAEALQPAVPEFLPPLPEGAPQNRLGLAQWLVSEENPLTARVAVNRLWQKFFGEGIVSTSENFGMQSDPRTHPELLDWLATEFVRQGWDLKAIQKTIVMSATYRQDSAVTPELRERDPKNLLLARGPRFRLPAESIRDNALATSGLLVKKIGGPSVMPYQPDGLWDELAGGAGQGPYVLAEGDDLYRRTLYTYRKRTVPHPSVATFDAPAWELCRVQRARTNTPLQALALLNDVTYVEAARNLAQRMLLEAPDQETERVRYGFRVVTGRYPTETEQRILVDGLDGYLDTYAADTGAADALLSEGKSPVSVETTQRPALAAYTAVAGVMLNLDEAMTKE